MQLLQLQQQFLAFQRTFKGNTLRSIQTFEEHFKSFAKHTKATTILELEPPDLNLPPIQRKICIVEKYFVDGQVNHKWAKRTIRNRMSSLNSFCKWCVERGYLSQNPVERLPRPKLGESIPRFLTREESMTILQWIKCHKFTYAYEKPRALALFTMFSYTGMRLSELLSLKLSDIDIENRSILIRFGKGDKQRVVPMPEALVPYIEDFQQDRERLKIQSQYFFFSMKKKGKMDYQVLKRLCIKIEKATNIKVHPHKLRHSYAVQTYEATSDIFYVSSNLGHSDVKTTVSTYCHVTLKHKRHLCNHLSLE